MNLELNYEGFEDYLKYKETNHVYSIAIEGVQYLFVFDNGYAASVIKAVRVDPNGTPTAELSYGGYDDLWELAVCTYDTDVNDDYWEPCYDTPITDNVEGHLTDLGVRTLMEQIKNLPEREKEN